MVSNFIPVGRPDPTFTTEALARRLLNLREDEDAIEDFLYTVLADPETPQNVVSLASAWLQQIDNPESLFSGPTTVFSHAEQIIDISRKRR